MEKVTIEMETINDAFVGNEHLEIARILRGLADRFEDGQEPSSANDYNGNKVAYLDYK